MDTIIASARQVTALTSAIRYSAAYDALTSLDTQIRPTYSSSKTPSEFFERQQPNLEEIFKFRLGQLVIVTKLTEHRSKTDHNLAGVVC